MFPGTAVLRDGVLNGAGVVGEEVIRDRGLGGSERALGRGGGVDGGRSVPKGDEGMMVDATTGLVVGDLALVELGVRGGAIDVRAQGLASGRLPGTTARGGARYETAMGRPRGREWAGANRARRELDACDACRTCMRNRADMEGVGRR